MMVMVMSGIKTSVDEANRVQGSDDQDVYFADCIPICKVPVSECPSDVHGLCWYRTVDPVPNFSGGTFTNAFVSANGGMKPIEAMSNFDLLNKNKSIRGFIQESHGYFLRKKPTGTYAYFLFDNKVDPDGFSANASWTNPMDLLKYSRDPGVSCNFLDQPLDMDPRYETLVYEKTYQLIASKLRTGVEQDIVDDEVDGSQAPRQQVR